MTSLNWVTVVWSMIASASLTLATIYWVVWLRNRHAWAHLLFSLTAGSLPFYAYCELWVMRAGSPEELLQALRFGQVAAAFLLVSLTWFVAIYLHAGRRWIAWTASGMRVGFALLSFFGEQNTNFIEIPSVRRIEFLGESVSILRGVPNPVMLVGQISGVLLLIFVAARPSLLMSLLAASSAADTIVPPPGRQYDRYGCWVIAGGILGGWGLAALRVSSDLVLPTLMGLAQLPSDDRRLHVFGGAQAEETCGGLTGLPSNAGDNVRRLIHALRTTLEGI